MPMTLRQLARRIEATLEGDGATEVSSCAPITSAGPTDVTFFVNQRYASHLATTQAAAVLVRPETRCPEHLTRLVADDPYYAFRNAMIELHGHRVHPPAMDDPDGHRSPMAAIHPEAVVAESAVLHPHVTVERGAVIGASCVLYPGAYVGEHVSVGDETVLHPNVTVYDRCVIGKRVIVHASSVIGHDGFGHATHEGVHHKIPQSGVVVIEDDVEIGGGCAIERAAMGETRIGRGSKMADLISIGHGTTIGSHCLLVSLVGVAGSVTMGDGVVLGGQSGIAGHITIGDGVQAMARAGVVGDVPPGLKIGGAPAIPADQAKRNFLVGADLHGMARRLRRLEHAVEALEPPP